LLSKKQKRAETVEEGYDSPNIIAKVAGIE